MTTREQTIERLETSKVELVADLRRAAGGKLDGTEWYTDRVNELARINRTLARMGAAPAAVVVA